MQSDPHHGHRHGATHGYDAHSRLPEDAAFPPSSPSLSTAFHHHHQPAAPFAETDVRPALKHRHTSQTASDRLVVAIATPLSDRDRRKERTVATSLTVSELKDLISSDDAQDKWDRNGMRLVWQGRIVRDEEELGSIVGKHESGFVHTFHLVARRVGPSSSVSPPVVRQTSTETPVASASTISDLPVETGRVVQALADSTHYLLFTARHHLCHLLNTPPLAWKDTVPPPVVEQDVARDAVMSVVGAFAARRSVREEGWENWEAAFAHESDVGAKGNDLESEVRSLWSSVVGTNWKDGDAGEVTAIELDFIPYQLHLPPLSLLNRTQLSHLVIYLRITNLLPLVNNVLEISQHDVPAPAPTPTIADLVARVEALTHARPRPAQTHLRLTLSTLSHITLNGFKVGIALFMLTSHMRWDNVALWILGGGLFGWWLGDAMETIRPGLIWGAAEPAGRAAARGNDAAAAQPAANAALPDGAAPAAAAAAAGRAGLPVLPTLVRPGPLAVPAPITLVTQTIPLIHLETDSEHLHLTPARPRYQPSRFITLFLLPVSLWFITFFPAWERKRARAIRQREREMRSRVQELVGSAAEAEERQETAEQSRPPVLPPGLGPVAKKYYTRVIARGEEIDWEEEREAQRAMGVEG